MGASAVWRLDDPSQQEIARADFGLTTAPHGTLLLDEWQHVPALWDSVRRQVDAGASPGRFLLTGSATPVSSAGTHSGAGRILSLRMRPMALHERGDTVPTVSVAGLLSGTAEVGGQSDITLKDYVEAIVRGGFPGIMNAAPGCSAFTWMPTCNASSIETCLTRGSRFAVQRRCGVGSRPTLPPPRQPRPIRRSWTLRPGATAPSQPRRRPSPTVNTSPGCGCLIRSLGGCRQTTRCGGSNRRRSITSPTQPWRRESSN